MDPSQPDAIVVAVVGWVKAAVRTETPGSVPVLPAHQATYSRKSCTALHSGLQPQNGAVPQMGTVCVEFGAWGWAASV